MVHRIQGALPYIPSMSCNSAGPGCAEGIDISGNTVKVGDYTAVFDNKFKDNAVTVYNKNGEKILEAGGDPHAKTRNGKADFHNDMTLNLPDGTKMTFTTTADEKNEKDPTYLKNVTITKPGSGAVVASYDGNGNPSLQQLPRFMAETVDRHTPDGLELAAGRDGSIRVIGGPEIEGDMGNLDVYRSGQRWGNRPDIGLPGWRHDGPSRGWDFARHDHRHDYHHHHHHHDNDCGRITPEIQHLLDRLESYQRQARHGSWFARLDARHHIDRIEHRLRELRA